MELEYYTKIIGAITASTAMIGGGYTLADKFGVFHKDILKWSPEHFQISDAPANGEFKVVVARQKDLRLLAMRDWAEALIAAACIVAFVIYGTYMIAWGFI